MKLSLVIPCYNEAENIPLIATRFAQTVSRKDVELLFVDNASTDDSSAVLEKILKEYPFASSIRIENNRGYGAGVVEGLKTAKGEYIGWTHADMQTDPYDAVRALELIEASGGGDSIYVKGKRKGRPVFDALFTAGMGLFESVYLGVSLRDINAQPNIFHRSFFENWKNPPHDFSLDLYALYTASRQGLNIVRFPVLFPKRIHGTSSWNTGLSARWKLIKRTVDFSVKLKKDL